MPTRGRACAAIAVIPAAASSPRSAARSGRPAGASTSPGRASSPGCRTPSPGATARSSSTCPGIGSVVCSTITTASAPCGSSPPVGIAIAAPGPTSPSGARPIATAPVTSRNAGSVSDAA